MVSRRYWFLTIYSVIAVFVGSINVWLIEMLGVTAQQLFALSVPDVLTDGEFFSTTRPMVTLSVNICGVAPIILVLLAIIRGRRIGNRSLVVYPVLGLIVMLLGALPFMLVNAFGDFVAFAPTAVVWFLDLVCLRRGSRESKVAPPINPPKA